MDLVAVAEEFILGFPAPTERYSVSNLIEMAVGEFHWDSTTYPNRADDPMAGQHNQRYGGIQVWFDGVTVLVSLNQTTGWAVCGLFDGDLAQNPILQRFHSLADRQLRCQSREMDRYLREHEAYIRRCLEEDNPGTDWASLLAFHRTSWLSCSMSG